MADHRNVDVRRADIRDDVSAGDAELMPEQPTRDLKLDPDAQDRATPGASPVRPAGVGALSPAAVEEDTNAAGVIRDYPGYVASDAGTRMLTAAVAGVIGAAILAAIMYLLYWANPTLVPSFLEAERRLLGTHGFGDHLAALAGFLVAGAVWGALFGLLVRRPTWFKGVAFGFVPTLFLWLVMAPLMGKGLFMGFGAPGLLVPIVFNVCIWGSIVGRYCEQRLRPPSTSATKPTTDIVSDLTL